MLSELIIRNFAIIDDLRMQFAHGFVVLTGETGAGKSIILDAVSLILGGRADSSMVRAGSERATVEAAFSLPQMLKESLVPLLKREGLENEDENLLSLGREVRQNGRTVSRVNGRSVSLSLMRQIAEPLVDIHGQGEHLSLLKPRAHLPLLDSYGRLDSLRQAFSAEVELLRQMQNELASLQQDERLIAQRIDMLQYQIREIGAAELQVGEEEELRKERTRLANAEQLNRLAVEITAELIGLDDDTPAATDLLGKAERALGQLARLDGSKSTLLENLQGISFQLNELAAEVQDYQQKLEFNPQRLNEVEERLELINTLKRKYGDSIVKVLATRDLAEAQLERISHNEDRIAMLEEGQERLLRQIGRLGEDLSKKRQDTAQRLSSAVEKQLNDLQLAGARFEVQLARELDADGAYIDDARYAFDATGIDRAEFIISANPGEPLKPVAKVASGGETARLMLALKTALAEVDSTPTLIFDEIDQGIGGRVGGVVGRKLWRLTTAGNHQVIVVTHLPQLAGYGDVHFHVSKHVINGRTSTAVTNLDVSGRIGELADMLGTSGISAVGGAEAILRQVQDDKSGKL
jgi:DNA repair protein RecN (Recombination protein N)